MKKALGLALVLLASLFVINVGNSEAQSFLAITVLSDGTVSPAGTPLVANGTVYTLMGNVFGSITTQKDNVIFDGGGFTLEASSSSNGVDLNGRNNVTVKNFNIKSATHGINLNYSWANSILQNNVTSSQYGIYLSNSCGNNLSRNIVSSNTEGIRLTISSTNNALIENQVSQNRFTGLLFEWGSCNNTLRRNQLRLNLFDFTVVSNSNLDDWVNDIDTSNRAGFLNYPIYYWINHQNEVVPQEAGCVVLIGCRNITVKDQWMVNVGSGILLVNTFNSQVLNNRFNACNFGVYLWQSSNNVISGNNFLQNDYGIYLDKSSNNVLHDNTFNNASQAYVPNNLYLTSSSGNKIYRNNFILYIYTNVNPVPQQVLSYSSANTWSDISGNYWSDYKGTDSNGDGVGDTPYVIDSNNQDSYPLMKSIDINQPAPIPSTVETPTPSGQTTSTANPTSSPPQTTTIPTAAPTTAPTPDSSGVINAVTVQGAQVELSIRGNITITQISNATITTNQTTVSIAFTITGQAGTTGFVNMTIPKHAVPNGGSPEVYVSGQLCQDQGYTQDNDNFYVWYITHFSTHQFNIVFLTVTASYIPQNHLFQSFGLVEITILGSIIVLAISLVAAVLFSRKNQKTAPII
jgi:parallel beta-helix repeat protein